MGHYHHVVLFRLHDDADAERAVEVLERSRPSSGLVSWTIRRSIDERKGVVIAEVAVFDSPAAFADFRASARHREAGAHLAEVADWTVADWIGR